MTNTTTAIHDAAHEVFVEVVAQLDEMSDTTAQHLGDLSDAAEAEEVIDDLLGSLRAAVTQRFADWCADHDIDTPVTP
jgi:hypothetical protein